MREGCPYDFNFFFIAPSFFFFGKETLSIERERKDTRDVDKKFTAEKEKNKNTSARLVETQYPFQKPETKRQKPLSLE